MFARVVHRAGERRCEPDSATVGGVLRGRVAFGQGFISSVAELMRGNYQRFDYDKVIRSFIVRFARSRVVIP